MAKRQKEGVEARVYSYGALAPGDYTPVGDQLRKACNYYNDLVGSHRRAHQWLEASLLARFPEYATAITVALGTKHDHEVALTETGIDADDATEKCMDSCQRKQAFRLSWELKWALLAREKEYLQTDPEIAQFRLARKALKAGPNSLERHDLRDRYLALLLERYPDSRETLDMLVAEARRYLRAKASTGGLAPGTYLLVEDAFLRACKSRRKSSCSCPAQGWGASTHRSGCPLDPGPRSLP